VPPKEKSPWWRKKNSQNIGAFAALPCPPSELPESLGTKRWRADLPGWEDRPRDPQCEHASVPFRPPQGLGFDPLDTLLPVESEE
jgi:hypothetical protein